MNTPRALTLYQPWASLIAVGAKSIETRSWSTSYRGPLLIHAALAHDIDTMRELGRIAGWHGPISWWDMRDGPLPTCAPGIEEHVLPVGAVVASATLTDCVPIATYWTGEKSIVVVEDILDLASPARDLSVYPEDDPYMLTDVRDQRPFGDFSPGRWAWLLEDVKPTTERCPRCWGGYDPTLPIRPRFCAACDPMLGKRRDVYHVYEGECRLARPGVPPRRTTSDEIENAAYVHRVEQELGRLDCPTCGGAGKCEPVPMRGRQGLWTPDWSKAAA